MNLNLGGRALSLIESMLSIGGVGLSPGALKFWQEGGFLDCVNAMDWRDIPLSVKIQAGEGFPGKSQCSGLKGYSLER